MSPDLLQFVQKYHVHYEVGPELLLRRGEWLKVGFEVQLWAVHPKGTRALPGCAKCRRLAAGLDRLAREVLPKDECGTLHVIEPLCPALYDSRIIAGTDEVYLAIRIVHQTGYDRPVDGFEERCLGNVRRGLKEMGVLET